MPLSVTQAVLTAIPTGSKRVLLCREPLLCLAWSIALLWRDLGHSLHRVFSIARTSCHVNHLAMLIASLRVQFILDQVHVFPSGSMY